jgi:hypothetical protein
MYLLSAIEHKNDEAPARLKLHVCHLPYYPYEMQCPCSTGLMWKKNN